LGYGLGFLSPRGLCFVLRDTQVDLFVDRSHPTPRNDVVFQTRAKIQLGQFNLLVVEMIDFSDVVAVRAKDFHVFGDRCCGHVGAPVVVDVTGQRARHSEVAERACTPLRAVEPNHRSRRVVCRSKAVATVALESGRQILDPGAKPGSMPPSRRRRAP